MVGAPADAMFDGDASRMFVMRSSSRLLGERPIEALPAVQQVRHRPARNENADDQIAEVGKTAVEIADRVPETALKTELAGDQPERLDTADQKRDDDRDGRDGEVVPDLADRIEECPPVGAHHEHTVGGIDE